MIAAACHAASAAAQTQYHSGMAMPPAPQPHVARLFVNGVAALAPRGVLFGRVEQMHNDKLVTKGDPLTGRAVMVAKFCAGYAHRLPLGGGAGPISEPRRAPVPSPAR